MFYVDFIMFCYFITSLALDFQLKWPFSLEEEYDWKKRKPAQNFQLEIFKYKIRSLQ